MFWNRENRPLNKENEIYKKIRRFQLKKRVENACKDNTDYELRLRNFCNKNKDNILLLTRIKGYRLYLLEGRYKEQEAAKLVLEEYCK